MAKEDMSDDRESIRRKLANSKEGEEENEEDKDKNLLICFMNEALVEEDEDDEEQRNRQQLSLDKLTAVYIAKNNISRKKGHVIIPLTPSGESPSFNSDSDSGWESNKQEEKPHESKGSDSLSRYFRRIRKEARSQLKKAKQEAKENFEAEKQNRNTLILDIEALFGIKIASSRKLSRRLLTDMNIAQLQVILNFLLSRVESLNEDLVQCLMNRDTLIREQDALLTDIEDITNGINGSDCQLKL